MRRSWSLGAVVAGGIIVIGGLGSAAITRDAISVTADSPLVGAWLIDTATPTTHPTHRRM